MFWPDVMELKKFYGTPLGALACRAIRRRIREFWPEMADGNNAKEYILGIGFAIPYLMAFLDGKCSNSRAISIMPAAQGIIHWPQDKKNRTALAAETSLPLPDNSIERIILVHMLEYSDHPSQALRELWRILKPNGKILVIVPNRKSIWSRTESTPLGYGQPFSTNQLRSLLGDNMLYATREETALFIPPTHSKTLLKAGLLFEGLGKKIMKPMGGVIIMEAEKQLYAEVKRGKPAKKAFAKAVD